VIRELEIVRQEGPGRAGERCAQVAADVAAPHDLRAPLGEVPDEPGGLRIVQDDHVAGSDPRRQRAGVGGQDVLVDRPFASAQRTPVAGVPVHHVVDALGDREELGRAADDEPVRVDSCATAVAGQRAQQLGHAAPVAVLFTVHSAAPASSERRSCMAIFRLARSAGVANGARADARAARPPRTPGVPARRSPRHSGSVQVSSELTSTTPGTDRTVRARISA
jgi:hypothetical protein